MTSSFLIQAVVSEGEKHSVRLAAEQMADIVGAEGGKPFPVECIFHDNLATLDRTHSSSAIVVSLVEATDDLAKPWPDLERELRAGLKELVAESSAAVFITTIFRHVPAAGEPRVALARRVRVRQLNSLAPELSRELGLFVVDIDRDLADLGAQVLQTDYRLNGPRASQVVSKSIALTLLINALDSLINYETLAAAEYTLRAYQPIALEKAHAPVEMISHDVISIRSGRRSQRVATTIDTVDENFVALQIKRLLKGQITPFQAVGFLMRAIRNKGWRASLGRLMAGLRKVGFTRRTASS